MMLRSKGLLPLTVVTGRSTLCVPASLEHAQSATIGLLAHAPPGPNPTFAGASSAKWAFDPNNI